MDEPSVERERVVRRFLKSQHNTPAALTPAFWQSSRIVNFLVLSAAVHVLEWTVTCKPNVEHGKMVGYGGY
jgi:hypothetical protein